MTAVQDASEQPTHDEPIAEGSQTEEEQNTSPEGIELKQSRKREREVSLEPGTPQALSVDVDSTQHDRKDHRVPAKKNRVSAQLDATEEVEESGENANDADEDVSGSPPEESKIRQISQGVEDLTWRNMKKDSTPEREHPEGEEKPVPMETEHGEREHDEQPEQAEVPPLLRSENPPVAQDDAGVDEHSGGADPAEVPPEAQDEQTPAEAPAEDKEEEAPATPPQREASPIIVSPLPDTSKSSRRGSESSTEEKRLKRKLADRSISESAALADSGEENESAVRSIATKRPRDDADQDDNPRETKRPTPPPDEDKAAEPSSRTSAGSTTEAAPTQNIGGFAAYASSSSPFASVKGPSLFANKSSPWASTSTSSFPSASSSPKPGSSSIVAPSALFNSQINSTPTRAEPSALKRTGFEAFASSSSFGSVKRSKSPPPPFGAHHRSKSPMQHAARAANVNVNAFSAYATGGAHAFSKPAARRAGSVALGEGVDVSASASASGSGSGEASASQGSEDEGSRERKGDGKSETGGSFGARLRAQKDVVAVDDEEQKKEDLAQLREKKEVKTGEEDEDTLYQVRGKLYELSDGNAWKERGTGQLKLNVRREDGGGARLLMRKEAVYNILLNVSLFKGMKCFLAQDPRYLRFSVLEGGNAIHYNLRVSNAKIAAELLEEISSHIPGE